MTKRMSDDDDFTPYSGMTTPTVKINSQYEDSIGVTAPYDYGEPKTRIYRGPGEPEKSAEIPAKDPMSDPVVGWLVVTFGPGRGASLNLGYGRNSIGRDAGERVCLNFGDDQISRSGHANIAFDPRSRRFYLQSGTGANLTYIEGRDEPVLTPVLLRGGEVLLLGGTQLKFVPFCGPDFDWHGG
ncbi:MAG TPA: FHA domain-containing protein [Skermanella sp.]|nr:FHA domain-containing protein [Skermanella sp.]